ncbi:MAG: hypothetical protein ACREPM_02860 [Gemmatimonadaceae bacterium]
MLERPPRLFAEELRIFDERDFAFLVVAQREMPVRLGPGKALPEPYVDHLVVEHDEQSTVSAGPQSGVIAGTHTGIPSVPTVILSAAKDRQSLVILSDAKDLLLPVVSVVVPDH